MQYIHVLIKLLSCYKLEYKFYVACPEIWQNMAHSNWTTYTVLLKNIVIAAPSDTINIGLRRHWFPWSTFCWIFRHFAVLVLGYFRWYALFSENQSKLLLKRRFRESIVDWRYEIDYPFFWKWSHSIANIKYIFYVTCIDDGEDEVKPRWWQRRTI